MAVTTLAGHPSDWDKKLAGYTPEKRTRFEAYQSVVSAFGTPSQAMFVIDNDDEFETFKTDFNEFMTAKSIVPSDSKEKPYHVVKVGYDGDMLDDMFRLVVSEEADNFRPSQFDPNMQISKQAIFQQLYRTVTKDKFLIFHLTEFPLAYYFETAVAVDVEELADVMDPSVHDETIMRYLNDLRRHGTDEHRKTYSFFYRISTSLMMELSNVFLVVPTAGMNRHLVVTSWRTQTLLLGFSPLTWSSGSFRMFDLSGRDIDGRWAFPVRGPSDDSRAKGYTSLVPL